MGILKSDSSRLVIRVVASYGVAGACLYWVFHDIHLAEVIRSVSFVNVWMLPPAVALQLLVYVCGGWEWKILLRPVCAPSLKETTQAIFAARFANDVLPVHVGYIVRIYLLCRWTGSTVASIAPSFLIERLFDGIWLALGIGLVGIFFSLPRDINAIAESWAGIIVLGLVAGGWILFRKPRHSEKVRQVLDCASPLALSGATRQRADAIDDDAVPQLASNKISIGDLQAGEAIHEPTHRRSFFTRIHGFAACVLAQVRTTGRSRLALAAFGISFVKFVAQCLAFLFVLRAYGFQLSWWSELAVFAVAYVGLSLPSTPASLGVFQVFCIAGLQMFHVSKPAATGFALLAFVVLTVPLSVAGFIALAQSGVTLRQVRREAARLKVEG